MATLPDQTNGPLRNAQLGEQLARIVNSQTFAGSPRARALLDFLVHSAIEGNDVRESVIRVKVFGRSGRWDSKRSTIVRTSIVRLRHLLAAYYESEGTGERCELRIPKGAYIPEVTRRDPRLLSHRPTVHLRTVRVRPHEPSVRSGFTDAIVGRDVELADLHAHFKEAGDHQGSLVCVAAEPGIGKTALIEQFLFEVSKRPGQFCASACCYPELETAEPYGVWKRLLRGLAQSDTSIMRLLRKTAPSWVLFLNENKLASSIFQAAGAGRELFEFVTALSQRKPVVFVLDDLHWADAQTIYLLQYLCLQSVSLRLLIVVAYRSSDLRRRQNAFLTVQPELKLHSRCIDLTLRELTKPEVERVTDLRFAPNRFDAAFISWLFARTQGNAFVLTQVMEDFVRRGSVHQVRRRWVTRGQPEDWDGDLPDSVHGWIAQKLEYLDDSDMSVALIASIHGGEFEARVLAHALGRDAVSVERQIEHMERVHGLFRRLPDVRIRGYGTTRHYRFSHPLFQETLLRRIGPVERARSSLRLADALLQLYGAADSMAATAARLLEESGNGERALERYLAATSYAIRISAYKQALETAHRAEQLTLGMTPTELTDRRAIECLTLQALAASTLGGFGATQIEGIYSRALRISRRLEETAPFSIANVYWSFVSNTNFRKGKAIAGELLVQADTDGQLEAIALAKLAMGVSCVHLGEISEAVGVLKQAQRIWDSSSSGRSHFYLFTFDPAVATLLTLARVHSLLGQWNPAKAVCESALRLAREIGHERTLTYAMALSADTFHWGGDARKALTLAEEGERMAATFELPYEGIWTRAIKAWALAQLGETTSAIALFENCLADYRGPASTKLLCHYAKALTDAGRLTEAAATLDQAVMISKSLDEHYYFSELLRARGELILRKTHASRERAAQLFREALDLAAAQGAKTLELRAAISVTRLDRQQGTFSREMRDRLKQVLDVVAKGGTTPDVRLGKTLLSA